MPKLQIPASLARALPWTERALGLCLILVGIGLRFYRLSEESIWLDEAQTFLRSSLPLPDLLRDTIERHHTPAYFLLMHGVLGLGDDEFMLRLPSAIFGSLALCAAIALGVIVGGLRTGVITGVLFALAPLLLRYSQEARMYSMFVFFSTCALCGLAFLVKHPRAAASWPFPRAVDGVRDEALVRNARRAWLSYAAATIAVLYTHNTAALFWAACWVVGAIVWIFERERRGAFLRNWLAVNAAVFLVWAPWLKILAVQAKEVSAAFWAAAPTLATVLQALDQLYLFGSHGGLPGSLVFVFVLIGLWSLREHKPLAVSLISLSLLAPLMVLLISLHRPIWLPRVMLWATVPFFVLAACGIAALKERLWILLVLLAIVIPGAIALESKYFHTRQKPEWERALREVAKQRGGSATLFVIGPREHRPIAYYTQRKDDPVQGLTLVICPPAPPGGERQVTRIPNVNCTPADIDALLIGRRNVSMFVATDLEYATAIVDLMGTRGRLTRKMAYGHKLMFYDYRVYQRFRNPRKAEPEPSAPN